VALRWAQASRYALLAAVVMRAPAAVMFPNPRPRPFVHLEREKRGLTGGVVEATQSPPIVGWMR